MNKEEALMKKILLVAGLAVFLGACSTEYEVEYTNESFTLGNSLTYEMPILESDLLQPTLNQEFSMGDEIQILNNFWFTDEKSLLSTVDVGYRLVPLDYDYLPYYYLQDDELTEFSVTEVVKEERVTINNREWFHVETAPITFESDGEELRSVDQTYYYRSGFELYNYTFKLTAPKEEYNDQERVALTNERIEEVLGMADFSHEPTKTKEEIHTVLNGTWDAGDSGYLHFNAGELKWYKDSNMQEENVLLIDVTDVVPLIHPENDTEYALLQLDYLTETIDGQTYDSETELTLLINFMDDNNIILADYQTLEYYKLSKVE